MKSFVLNQEELARSQQAKVNFNFKVASGVCTLVNNRGGFSPRCLIEATVGTAAKAIVTQTLIDTLLKSTNEIISDTAFGTTALVDDDTVAMVFDMGGQVDHVISAYAHGFCPTALHYTSYGTAATWDSDAAITDADIDGLQVYVTSNGNLAVLLNHTNISAAGTSGHFSLNLNLKLK